MTRCATNLHAGTRAANHSATRVPRGVRVPTAYGTYRVQSLAGEHLIMDRAAKLVQGCTVTVFLGGKIALVGRIVRRPVPSRHLVIECWDVHGNKRIERMWGLKDKDVQIWRVTGVQAPVPDADEEEAEAE
jgi:hypothetical protein